jgi:hypothetical protein
MTPDKLVQSAYISMCESRNYQNLDFSKIKSVDVFHHKDLQQLSEETEEDFHEWARKTEPHSQLDVHAAKLVDHTNMWGKHAQRWHETHAPHEEENTPLLVKHKLNLEPKDYDHIHNITQNGLEEGETGSRKLNEFLIHSHENGKPKPSTYTREDGTHIDLEAMDHTFKKNKLDKGMTTYSGINFDPNKKRSDSGIVHLPAFTSTSIQRITAARYGMFNTKGKKVSHVLAITHPKGSTGMYIGNDEDFTPFRDNEFITPRHTTLNIEKEPTKYEMKNGTEIHVWKAKRLIGLEK